MRVELSEGSSLGRVDYLRLIKRLKELAYIKVHDSKGKIGEEEFIQHDVYGPFSSKRIGSIVYDSSQEKGVSVGFDVVLLNMEAGIDFRYN